MFLIFDDRILARLTISEVVRWNQWVLVRENKNHLVVHCHFIENKNQIKSYSSFQQSLVNNFITINNRPTGSTPHSNKYNEETDLQKLIIDAWRKYPKFYNNMKQKFRCVLLNIFHCTPKSHRLIVPHCSCKAESGQNNLVENCWRSAEVRWKCIDYGNPKLKRFFLIKSGIEIANEGKIASCLTFPRK